MPHALSRTEHSTSLLAHAHSTSKAIASKQGRRRRRRRQHMLPLLNTMEAPARSSKQQQLMRTVSISVLVMSLPVLYVSFLHVPPAALFRDTTFWFLMSNSIIIVIAADSGMLFFRSPAASCSADADADTMDGLSSFAVSGGEPVAAAVVKSNGHPSLMMGVSASVSDEAAEAAKNQALVVRGHGDLAVVGESGDHAYALVERHGDRASVVAAPEAREITAWPSSNFGAIVPATTTAPTRRLTASRSLAAREERRRQRHGGHRPSHSHSHSHALVPVQDKSVVVSEDRHLRRAATTDSRPPPPPEEETETEKESEYSRLSDEELNRRVEEFIARFNREIRLQLEKEEQAAMSAA